jgi:hypothetical protein
MSILVLDLLSFICRFTRGTISQPICSREDYPAHLIINFAHAEMPLAFKKHSSPWKIEFAEQIPLIDLAI